MIWMPFLFILLAFVMTATVMLLWNWLMPELFGLTEVSFWQALGILILSKILFGGFGGKHKYGQGSKCCHGHYGWKSKFKEKWQNMSEEDRKKWETKFGSSKWGSMSNCRDSEEKESAD